MKTIRIKFTEAVDSKVLTQTLKLGAKGIYALFRNETDPELKLLYTVKCPEDKEEKILKYLENAKSIEFVEPEVKRKLIK